MSGDMNTALGNCVLMIIMVWAALKKLNISSYEIFDDGDDCLIIIEDSDLETLLAGLGPIFLSFGQEIKIENVAREFGLIEWCQTRPVIGLDGQYQMCANWRKTLSQACAGTHYWDTRKGADMSFSVGQCILAVYPSMPILWKFSQRLCSIGSMHNDLINLDWIFKLVRTEGGKQLGQLEAAPPTLEMRTSFKTAWGIDEIEQLRIEQSLEKWHPCGAPPVLCGNPVSKDWEFNYPPGLCPTDRDIVPAPV